MNYEPDAQDELIADAEALGGPAFVEELHYAATAETDRLVPWDRTGAEPPERATTWITAARHLVAVRRAKLLGPKSQPNLLTARKYLT